MSRCERNGVDRLRCKARYNDECTGSGDSSVGRCWESRIECCLVFGFSGCRCDELVGDELVIRLLGGFSGVVCGS